MNNVLSIDLGQYGAGMVDVDQLPLDDVDKKLIQDVQCPDKDIERYILRNGHGLIPIEDVESLKDCSLEPLTPYVIDERGKRLHWYSSKKNHYYAHNYHNCGHSYRHRLVAEQTLRVADPIRYDKVRNNPTGYHCHHLRPDLKRLGLSHADSALNLKLIPIERHKAYDKALKRLKKKIKAGAKVELLKPAFYQLLS